MLICFASLQVFSQAKNNDVSRPDPKKKIQIVETSCGECKFNLEGDTNELKQFSDNSYFNPFTLYSFYYSKDFTKAGNDIYKVFSSAIGLGSSSQKWLPNYKRK